MESKRLPITGSSRRREVRTLKYTNSWHALYVYVFPPPPDDLGTSSCFLLVNSHCHSPVTLTEMASDYFNASALFRALTKEVDIGISAQAIEDDVVEDILMQGGAVSPIVTIEPRRRKFHKAVTVTIPLPERLPHYNNGGGGGTARTLATATSAGSSKRTSMESLNRTIGGKRIVPRIVRLCRHERFFFQAFPPSPLRLM